MLGIKGMTEDWVIEIFIFNTYIDINILTVNLERKEQKAQSNNSDLNYVRKDLEISQHETLSHEIADVFHSVQIFRGAQKNYIKSKKEKRLLEVFTYSKKKRTSTRNGKLCEKNLPSRPVIADE